MLLGQMNNLPKTLDVGTRDNNQRLSKLADQVSRIHESFSEVEQELAQLRRGEKLATPAIENVSNEEENISSSDTSEFGQDYG